MKNICVNLPFHVYVGGLVKGAWLLDLEFPMKCFHYLQVFNFVM